MNNTTAAANFTNSSSPSCLNINTTAAAITKVLIYSVITIVSLLGNSLLVFVFFRTKAMKKTIDVFVANMAVSDLFIPVFLISRLIVFEITRSEAFLIQGTLGTILCKISNFLTDVSISVSTHSLVLITFERFLAVVFPFTVRQIASKLRLYAILFVWIIAMGIHAPYFYTFSLTETGHCDDNWEPAFNHELTHPRYYTALFVVVVILPFAVITILYSVILWTLFLKKDEISMERSQRRRERNDKIELRELKVLRLALAIVIAFALCWAPFNIVQFLYLFAGDKIPKCSLPYLVYSEAAFVLAMTYCTINPIICFIFMKNYRLQESLASLRSQLSSSHKSSQRETEL